MDCDVATFAPCRKIILSIGDRKLALLKSAEAAKINPLSIGPECSHIGVLL